jgi:DNA-binding LytR/AlgR family response regulator
MFENKLCFQLIGSQYILLTPIEVLYLEADRQVCNIALADGTRIVAVRHLGYYKKELLQNFRFLELSKSILVNAAHLVKYSPRERMVHLGSGHALPVSKTRQEVLNKTFRQLHDNWLQGLDTSDDSGGATE